MLETKETTQEAGQPIEKESGGEAFLNNFWDDKPVNVQQQEVKKTDVHPAGGNEEIPVPKDWLKKEFDIEDPAVLKAEREELKSLRGKAPEKEEIKFENEQSKQIFELLKEGKSKEVKSYLEQQERLEQFSTAEVTKDNAAEIIKMGLQLKHPGLTQLEIEYKFNKEYGIPKEPQPKDDDLEGEYEARRAAWQEQVADIETGRTIEAKLLKPELEKAKANLVLPEINKPVQQEQQLTQEELDAAKKEQDAFLQTAKTVIDSFAGFSTQIKDKDVDFSVNYALSKEEKDSVSERVKLFTESGFNANAVFMDRWVKEGKLNEAQMIEDLSRVLAGKSSDAKIASEAANQRLELYLKEKKQIKVGGDGKGNFMPEDKTSAQKMQENFWGN